MRILVFGAGAVGSAVGGFLQQAGHEVTLYGNTEHLRAVERQGLHIDGIFGKQQIRPGVCYSLLDIDPELVLITVKAYDTPRAANELSCLDNGRRRFLHLQNGIGNYEILAQHIDPARLFSGMIIIGFTRPEPGRVTVTVYGGDIRIGKIGRKIDGEIQELANVFSHIPLRTHPADRIESYLWSKLFYNAALNPLGAILRVNYGRLSHPDTREIIAVLNQEAFAVAAACAIPLFWNTPAEYDDHLWQDLVPPTAGHRPSMLDDLERGKRTEIDFLNGALCRLGAERGMALPVNETLVRQIHFLEMAGGRPSA